MGKNIDLTGLRFGIITILGLSENKVKHRKNWLCKCDCGKLFESVTSNFGVKKCLQSCGCVRDENISKRSIKDLTGLIFGKLTVCEITSKRIDRKVVWNCICDCGRSCEVISVNLINGDTTSCGCYKLNRKVAGYSSMNHLFNGYRKKAFNRNLLFDLNLEEFKIITSKNCHYCGIEPKQRAYTGSRQNGSYIYNGIDRKNNLIGYNSDNIVPCCGKCNWAKSTMPYDEFIAWLDRTSKFRNEKNWNYE